MDRFWSLQAILYTDGDKHLIAVALTSHPCQSRRHRGEPLDRAGWGRSDVPAGADQETGDASRFQRTRQTRRYLSGLCMCAQMEPYTGSLTVRRLIFVAIQRPILIFGTIYFGHEQHRLFAQNAEHDSFSGSGGGFRPRGCAAGIQLHAVALDRRKRSRSAVHPWTGCIRVRSGRRLGRYRWPRIIKSIRNRGA